MSGPGPPATPPPFPASLASGSSPQSHTGRGAGKSEGQSWEPGSGGSQHPALHPVETLGSLQGVWGPLGARQVRPPGRPHLFLRLQRNSFIRGLPRLNLGARAVPASIKQRAAVGRPRTGSAPWWVWQGPVWRPPSEDGQPAGPSTPPALTTVDVGFPGAGGSAGSGRSNAGFPKSLTPFSSPGTVWLRLQEGRPRGPATISPSLEKLSRGPHNIIHLAGVQPPHTLETW